MAQSQRWGQSQRTYSLRANGQHSHLTLLRPLCPPHASMSFKAQGSPRIVLLSRQHISVSSDHIPTFHNNNSVDSPPLLRQRFCESRQPETSTLPPPLPSPLRSRLSAPFCRSTHSVHSLSPSSWLLPAIMSHAPWRR